MTGVNLNIVLGIIAAVFSPLVIIGMIISDNPYWLVLDIVMIILLPIVGIKLIRAK